MSAGIVFAVILFACYPGAPLWVHFVAHRGPDTQNIQGTIVSGGHRIPVIANDGTPIGPGLHAQYLLGADANGRDLFVRILYGGRTSLTVGIASAVLCTLLAVLLALPAGYFGGVLDRAISRLFDLIWSFPVYLLAVALSASLVVGGLDLGPVHISSSSLLIPIFVIAVVFIPYVARPIRAEVLALRQREFVEAAIAHGAGPLRVMAREILPNVTATTLVLFTLIIANNILVEAALSFLGVGVSVLTPSWGNIIQEGYGTIVTAPWQTIAPGIAIMLSAISLNVLGDGLRDALDPHGIGRVGTR
jgi:peptide/nickel transport system permease protein